MTARLFFWVQCSFIGMFACLFLYQVSRAEWGLAIFDGVAVGCYSVMAFFLYGDAVRGHR